MATCVCPSIDQGTEDPVAGLAHTEVRMKGLSVDLYSCMARDIITKSARVLRSGRFRVTIFMEMCGSAEACLHGVEKSQEN